MGKQGTWRPSVCAETGLVAELPVIPELADELSPTQRERTRRHRPRVAGLSALSPAQAKLEIHPWEEPDEPRAPLHEDHRGLRRAFETRGQPDLEELGGVPEAVEIRVHEGRRRLRVLVNEVEGRTRHGDLRRDAETTSDLPREGRLPGAELPFEQDHVSSPKASREAPSQRFGLLEAREHTRDLISRRRHPRGLLDRRRRRNRRLFPLWCVGALAGLLGTSASAQPRDVYGLRARLDPEAHAVDGELDLLWHNRGAEPVDELWFHLYLNAFDSSDTVFARESGGAMRGVQRRGAGRIELGALTLRDENLEAEEADLLENAEEELIPGDFTQLRVPLPSPIGPGEAVRLHSTFRSQLPPVFARSGYSGSFHAVAQWFPKLAVREQESWTSFPYHARGEFYADFATYELEIRTPAAFVVGATGTLLREETDGSETARWFRAEEVHDAVFVAWDHFHETRSSVDGVEVRVLFPPGHDAIAAVHREATEDGLQRLGQWFGRYPYPQLTVVVPPSGAEGAAGMEYPQLFLTSVGYLAVPRAPALTEMTTLHELGHQWFQGLLATNEVAMPMLDEGLTQWVTGALLDARHGPASAIQLGGVSVGFFDLMRAGGVPPSRPPLPPGLPAYRYGTRDYGASVYARASVALETVRRTWGDRRFMSALNSYARAHRFNHPAYADLTEAFDAAYWPGFAREVLDPILLEGADASLTLAGIRSRPSDAEYETRYDVRRRGGAAIPVHLEIAFEDGSRQRVLIPGAERRAEGEVRSPFPAVSAVLDPDGHNLLDPEPEDDRWPRRREADRAFFARVLTWAAALLGFLGP